MGLVLLAHQLLQEARQMRLLLFGHGENLFVSFVDATNHRTAGRLQWREWELQW